MSNIVPLATTQARLAAHRAANQAIDLFEQKASLTFRQACAVAKASETLAREMRRRRRERHGDNGEKSRKPPDVVAQALLALRQATIVQRREIFAQFGPEEALNILTDIETAATSNGAAEQPSLQL